MGTLSLMTYSKIKKFKSSNPHWKIHRKRWLKIINRKSELKLFKIKKEYGLFVQLINIQLKEFKLINYR